MDEHVQVIQLGDHVQVVQVDHDDAPTVVYVPGTGGGVTEAELTAALSGYATEDYVDAAVVSGGDVSGVQAMIDDSIAAHRASTTPHPAYDAMRSLTLLFENGLA